MTTAKENAEKYEKLTEYPVAIPLSEPTITFIYGPDKEADVAQVSKSKMMECSVLLKGALLVDPSTTTIQLPLKYPAIFKKYCPDFSLKEAYLVEQVLESEDLCHLMHIAEYLCLDFKDDLRGIMAIEWETEIFKPAFCSKNISKIELLYFFHRAGLCSDDCFKIILYWLEDASPEYCQEMKHWFEGKLDCSFTMNIISYQEKKQFNDLHKDTGSVMDHFFSVSDVLSIGPGVQVKHCRRCKQHIWEGSFSGACHYNGGQPHCPCL